MKRIKLFFKKGLVDEEYKKVWYMVPHHAMLVSDLHYSIVEDFQLQKVCKYGLNLTLEGFLLVPSQSVQILRDNDIIRYTL